MHPYSQSLFDRFARRTASVAGQAYVFAAAAVVIALWAVTGPVFAFSNTWQLVINTVTTTVTFLMVFLIQNTQNRDSVAMHLKLDEIIRSIEGAHNAFLDLEELSEQQLSSIRDRYEELARAAREDMSGFIDTGSPQVEPQT